MNGSQGLVNRIIRFSAVDGPGNRLVIFLQGCNFHCLNCHNPHTIGLCNFCGLCVENCPAQALKIQSGETPEIIFADPLCLNCDCCLHVCPVDSNPRAHWYELAEIMNIIRQSAPFISGITVSGGEATLQLEFVRELFAAVKSDPTLQRLTTFLDSNGSASLEAYESLLPGLDGVMLDLKAFNPRTHLALTGASNEPVLRAIPFLYGKGKLYEVRILLIANYNTGSAEIEAIANFLGNIGKDIRIRLIPFRQHGVKVTNLPILHQPDAEILQECKKIFFDKGFFTVYET